MAANHSGSRIAARAEVGSGEGVAAEGGEGAGAEVDAASDYSPAVYRMLGRKTLVQARVTGPGAEGTAGGDGEAAPEPTLEGDAGGEAAPVSESTAPEAALEGDVGGDATPESELEGDAGGGATTGSAAGGAARAGGARRHGNSTSGEGEDPAGCPCANGKHNSSK